MLSVCAHRPAPLREPTLPSNRLTLFVLHSTHSIASRQFMVGPSLLVSPVLEQGATSVHAYFPPGLWHSLWGDGGTVDAG